MKYLKFSPILILLLCFYSCSSNESKLQSMLDREIGKSLLVEKTRLELDKVLGKKDCLLKESILDLISERVNIQYSNIVVDGRRARVHVRASVPRTEEVGSLLVMASFMPRDHMLNLSVEEMLTEISASGRHPAAHTLMQIEVYEFDVDFEKDKEWVANYEQIKKAYSRKNLVSTRL